MSDLERKRQNAERLQHEHEAVLIECRRLEGTINGLAFHASKAVELDPDALAERIRELTLAKLSLVEAAAAERWLSQRLTAAKQDLLNAETQAKRDARWRVETDPKLRELIRQRDALAGTPGHGPRRELVRIKARIEERTHELLADNAAVLAG